ncbi:hypothetical protein ACFPVX_14645 [Cohnella faecalis]|uniref:Uncharacterized protein n=1 Tax=Cohnella faecalis TaxID=2315694 RepID=A0A398CP34_9BACL|nr:hypothetical protein [Cohnella faecalis]RIE02518.1 hypothetical protein D3H35_17665 [Cohnella faecalis]
MIWKLTLAFAMIAAYEYGLLRRIKAGKKLYASVFVTTALCYVYGIAGTLSPNLVNPNIPIEALFGSIQDRIQLKR